MKLNKKFFHLTLTNFFEKLSFKKFPIKPPLPPIDKEK